MRDLQVTGLTADGKHVLLTTSTGRSAGYRVAVKGRLRKALDGELTVPGGKPNGRDASPAAALAPPVESALTPREIQARLRAGQAPERVAKAAGVPVDRVLRFYGPVLSERTVVVAAVRAATVSRGRKGASALPLGAAVTDNLTAKGIPVPDDDSWTAFRRADGRWIVRLALSSRGRTRRVDWLWDPTTRTATSTDTYAAALGHVESAPRSTRSSAGSRTTPRRAPTTSGSRPRSR